MYSLIDSFHFIDSKKKNGTQDTRLLISIRTRKKTCKTDKIQIDLYNLKSKFYLFYFLCME